MLESSTIQFGKHGKENFRRGELSDLYYCLNWSTVVVSFERPGKIISTSKENRESGLQQYLPNPLKEEKNIGTVNLAEYK